VFSRILSVEVSDIMKSGDGLVIFLIILVFGFWLYRYIRNRMIDKVHQGGLLIPEDDSVSEDEATRLLESEGYVIISGKQRIPIHIAVNDDEPLLSRLFIDYFVERDGLYYAVKTARERKPMDITGSSIRDHLLVFQLLYPQTAGVLYVDLKLHKVLRVLFQIDHEDEAESG
jgi:hypothetical protein